MRWTALSCALLFALTISPARADDRLRVLPEPREVSGYAAAGLRLNSGLTIAYRGVSADAAANAQIGRRWAVIGVTVGAPRPTEWTGPAQVVVSGLSAANRYLRARLGSEGYVLLADPHGVRIQAEGSAGRFYGLMTLCQLPRHDRSGWRLPSVKIVDWPALRWRGLSDDISRGPIPTIEFFEDRIRTLAAFKANLYSPYMEHVFFTAGDPLPAPPDALDAAQLRDLSRYAALFHITLMPEQETLGHMHHALAMQQYAALAEVPNGAVLSPAVPQSAEYAGRLVRAEAAAVTSRTPFFHIGGDEPFELGTGKARELLGRSGPAKLYADYFAPIWADVQAAGMRPVIWGDFLLAHPEAIPLLPKDVVIANWHYGAQRSFERFLQPFARAGLEQFVSPGDSNWGEIYPDISAAVGNTGRYIADGQRTRGVIGVLDTVWNDDGETLFNATWYPVLYGVAAGWQFGFADERRFHDRFAWSFFGTDGDRLTRDIDDLRQANTDLTTTPSDASDYQF
ncbi:MAG: beta-N-acetylhexosaminidase, partial [Candidatus Eremiobacteraeota bacterium]|nr:beta-N-acetylhexosaminidase [Candidatus Eremiobacteraeota bacterium]